ncbi:MAG: cold shock domain-containing protein [Nanoarchaeota archaeon]|nr:cold shock domain-containing protein [Nanoarchaeota archaeon]
MQGTVKWFKLQKGYGFILGEDGNEYFAHHTAIPEGVVLNKDDKVEFEPSESEKGKQAKDIKVVGVAEKSEEDPEQDSEDDYSEDEE